MPKVSIAKRSEGPANYRIPVSIARQVGRIVVAWAFFEYNIQTIVWKLDGVDQIVGRLAIREPRVADRLNLLCQLAELRGILINEPFYKGLLRSATTISEKRDLLAHGVWRREAGTWVVVLTRGTYPQGTSNYPQDVSEAHDVSRRIAPEGVHVDADALRTIHAGIEKLIEGLRAFSKALPDELPALRDKRPSRSRRKGRASGQTRKEPPTPT